jgi:hypothetical protein
VAAAVGLDAAVAGALGAGIDAEDLSRQRGLDLLLLDVEVRPHVLHVVVVLEASISLSICCASLPSSLT